jgi:hypothetical protein
MLVWFFSLLCERGGLEPFPEPFSPLIRYGRPRSRVKGDRGLPRESGASLDAATACRRMGGREWRLSGKGEGLSW